MLTPLIWVNTSRQPSYLFVLGQQTGRRTDRPTGGPSSASGRHAMLLPSIAAGMPRCGAMLITGKGQAVQAGTGGVRRTAARRRTQDLKRRREIGKDRGLDVGDEREI
jgi:hypothetical protein